MQNENLPTALRRSSRVPAELPIRVTALNGGKFSEVCKTLVVNAHGCALQTPVRFDTGMPLLLHSNDGRETMAHVVSCQPIGSENNAWKLGAKLDRPENFWGITDCPGDWSVQPSPISVGQVRIVPRAVPQRGPSLADLTMESKLDLVAHRLEAPLKRLIAESVAPLEAQVAALKETVARREANPSKFEVSLSSIPPQLEELLEERLRKDLGPRIVEDARQQYDHLLEAARSNIDKRTTEGYDCFLRRIEEEVEAVEKRTRQVSSEISAKAEEKLAQGMKEFQQKLLDGGNALKRLSGELFEFLQSNLNADYSSRREDLEKLRASIAEDSARLRQEIDGLEGRIAELSESARSLESGLDKRLGQMSSNVIKDTRCQIETLVVEVLDQLTANSAKTIEGQLADSKQHMAATCNGMLTSFKETLGAEATSSLLAFEHSLDDSARQSVDRWRSKLAGNLNTLAKNLSEEF